MAKETKTTQGGSAEETQERQTQQGQQSGAQREALRGSESRSRQQGGEVEVGQGQQGGAMRRGEGGLARYSRNPFAVMQQLSDEMDQLFDSFFYGTPVRRWTQPARMPELWAPEVEMCEKGNKLCVSVDLPGISKDDVKIDIEDGALVIQGERREERSEGGEEQGYRRSERRYGSFYRTLPLPEGADAEKAEAQMKDGVLEITLPLTERAQARRLEIKG